MTAKPFKPGNQSRIPGYQPDKADAPKWDGQEILSYDGMLVFMHRIKLVYDEVTLIEYPGGSTQDIIKVDFSTYKKLESATPEELEGIA